MGPAARDLSRLHALPRLRDGAADEAGRQAAATQAGRRARHLGLGAHSVHAAWQQAGRTLEAAQRRADAPAPDGLHRFDGTHASALNALLNRPGVRGVRVASPRLVVDEPLRLLRSGLWLDLGDAELTAPASAPPYLVRIESVSGVVLEGGVLRSGRWGVLVHDSRDVTVRAVRFDGLSEGGVVASAAPGLVVFGTTMRALGAAGVLLHGRTEGAAVVGNHIRALRGGSNWHAAIVLSDREADLAADPASLLHADRHGVHEQRIDLRLNGPRGNVVALNRLRHNLSSGLYSDGGIENVIADNLVEGNAKEGICLDNGSAANVLTANVVRANGARWGMSDAVLALDFVAGHGRLGDGSAAAKTPGVSIDNALYNVVHANLIDRNFGGGIKLVRTAFFNVIGSNVVTDNNEGASERFHFFGIELGAARSDSPVDDLDFTPSRGNVVYGNAIRGGHYAGIFLGDGSTDNELFDNTIFNATRWAIEQVRAQSNASLNNLSNLPSRHIGNGLDAWLLDAPAVPLDGKARVPARPAVTPP